MGKSHLYSYKRTEKIREKTVEDPETGELKIHENLLSNVLCFVWMHCQIPLTVFLRSDDLKRFIIFI